MNKARLDYQTHAARLGMVGAHDRRTAISQVDSSADREKPLGSIKICELSCFSTRHRNGVASKRKKYYA